MTGWGGRGVNGPPTVEANGNRPGAFALEAGVFMLEHPEPATPRDEDEADALVAIVAEARAAANSRGPIPWEEAKRYLVPAAKPKAPRLGSYTDATGSTTVACGCRLDTLPRCVVVTPCDGHRAVMVVEMRHREPGA